MNEEKEICESCGSENLGPIIENNGFNENPKYETVGTKCLDCGEVKYD